MHNRTKWPLQHKSLTGLEIERGDIVQEVAGELSSDDVHDCPDNTCCMRVARRREQGLDQGPVPFFAGSVKHIESIGRLALGILASEV